MNMDKLQIERLRDGLQSFDFKRLFIEELGWSHARGPAPLPGGEGRYGATDPVESARLRAELDGLIAHLYGLTEAEFAHILGTFPLVAEPVKIAALNAYRDVERGLIR